MSNLAISKTLLLLFTLEMRRFAGAILRKKLKLFDNL